MARAAPRWQGTDVAGKDRDETREKGEKAVKRSSLLHNGDRPLHRDAEPSAADAAPGEIRQHGGLRARGGIGGHRRIAAQQPHAFQRPVRSTVHGGLVGDVYIHDVPLDNVDHIAPKQIVYHLAGCP